MSKYKYFINDYETAFHYCKLDVAVSKHLKAKLEPRYKLYTLVSTSF